MADTSSFIAPARIQVLLVPVSPISRARFEHFANQIRAFSRIQLADVPPDSRGSRAVFSSSPTTPGALLFEYLTPTTYAATHPLAFLSEFQIHRRIHGIIGILDSADYTSAPLASALTGFRHSLVDLPVTFATKVYGFEPSERQLEEGRTVGEADGLVMIPGTGDVGFYLNTLLADFASDVLKEFSNMAAELESRTTIPTPQETKDLPSPFSYTNHRLTAKSLINSYAAPRASSDPAQRPINLASLGIAAPPQARTALGMWGGSQSGNQDGFLYGRSIQSNMQVKVLPGAPPGGILVDQKARKKVAGREKKLMGDLWLLAGRLEEAIACFNEAILLTKGWQDQVWQASALEGLTVALVIQGWAPRSTRFDSRAPMTSPPLSPGSTPHAPPDTSTFLASIPDRLSTAITLYGKMLPPSTVNDEGTPLDPDRAHPLVFAEACLRCARFLLAVWEAGGWIEKALERLVLPVPNMRGGEVITASQQADAARLTSMSPSNTVARSSIALWVSMAYSPQLVTLTTPQRLRVLGDISSMFGKIGYRRKESFVLREFAALCAESVAGRMPEVYTSEAAKERRASTTTLGGDEDDSIEAVTALVSSQSMSRSSSAATATPNDRLGVVRTISDSAGNDGIVRIAEKVCDAFGIEVVPTTPKDKTGKRKSVLQGRPIEILAEGKPGFGWQSLQAGVLRDAIAISEALPDYQAAIRFTVTALRTLSDFIPPEEQYRLSESIPRIFAAATRRGAAFDLEYWGPHQLVAKLEMTPLSPNRLPQEHPYHDSTSAKSTIAVAAELFIYNPNKGPAATKARPTLVQNEVAEVFVTLQNPFLFELKIQSIELSTSGVAFACDPLSTTIPPGSSHIVRLSGTPREAGLLTIRGCNIRLAGCAIREFVLPIWSEEDEVKRQKEVMLESTADRVKATGLAAFRKVELGAASIEGYKFLECSVVPEMPLLWMRSTNLTHGALMLYEGEVSNIRIGLENTSTSPVDFIKLTFTDQQTTANQNYVAENELPTADVHEIESDNLVRPVFTWSTVTAPLIAPGHSTVFEVQCLGKVGCASGIIQLDYSYVDREVVKSTSIFHTRQLFCNVFMTVHRALVTHSMEILRVDTLPESKRMHGRSASVMSLGGRDVVVDTGLEKSLREVKEGGHCLLSVDVMNDYGRPFDVTLQRSDIAADDSYKVQQRIEPGATARMLLRLERLHISPEDLARPTPSLTKRQFIVAKNKQSASQERLARELFWYREALLERISASWNEVGSERHGTISLRNLRLTKPMLDILRSDEVKIVLRLAENAAADPDVFRKRGKPDLTFYTARANDFMDVCALVVNNSAHSLHLLLQLELLPPDVHTTPAALAHLSRYVVVDSFSSIPLAVLGPGESTEARISLCLLAEGRYEFGCFVEELRTTEEATRDGERESRPYRSQPLVVEVDC